MVKTTASNTLIDDWFIGQASVVHRTEEAVGTRKVAGGYRGFDLESDLYFRHAV